MVTQQLKVTIILLTVLAGGMAFSVPARANVEEMKKYKEAFPGASVKCIDCHVDKIPKKDDGAHEWNAYGKAVLAQAGKEAVKEVEPTTDTYTHVGKIEDFKK